MIRKTIPTLSLLLLAAFVAMLCSCKPKDAGKETSSARVHTVPAGTPLKLAFVSNNANDFWSYARAGCMKFEKETGIHVEFKMPANGTVAEQKQILEDLLTQGYNGISMSIPAADSQTEDINKASKETNMICVDSDAPKSSRLMFIGTDNFEAGKLLGKEIAKLLPNGGDIAVFVGTMSADNAQKRKAGVEAALNEAAQKNGKHYAVVVTKEDNVNHGVARTNVEDVLNGYKNVKLLCGLWAYNGPAIANAIIDAKNKGMTNPPLAAVFDEDQGTLDNIRTGVISCTVVQHPFEFGYRASTYMRDLAYKGEAAMPKDTFVNTGEEVINASNVDEFSRRLADMKKYLTN